MQKEIKKHCETMLVSRRASFFVARMTIIGLLILIGAATFVSSGQVYAQPAHSTLIRQSWQAVDDSGPTMYAVAYDVTNNRYYTYGSPGLFTVASSIKVPILLTFLDMLEREGRGASDYEQNLMTTMIENSDNDAASSLYEEVGCPDGVNAYMQKIGLGELSIDPDAWGWSLISPRTMVDLFTMLNSGDILTEQDRSLALNLLENVESDQQVGVGDTAPPGATIALKDGWVIADDNLWAVNSSGIVTTSRDTYIISVYTQHEPTLEAGQDDVRQVCTTVATQLT
ncbi:MAG: hypothetical protein PVS3B1_39740 [Ktedonobacteraceae bacterium]